MKVVKCFMNKSPMAPFSRPTMMLPDTSGSDEDDLSMVSSGSFDSNATVDYWDDVRLANPDLVNVIEEAPEELGQPPSSSKLGRIKLMRLLWKELMEETTVLVQFARDGHADWSPNSQAKTRALEAAINAVAAPTGKHEDGSPAGDDSMHFFDIEYLVSTSAPMPHPVSDEVSREKRDYWFEICAPYCHDGHA
mmetsp:Transcript_50537/g.94010  ORF Transcript_50537/g.94010 Transcript_50537/m.94010 type:complete len:193 (+) Transcript_50537:56-634(+)